MTLAPMNQTDPALSEPLATLMRKGSQAEHTAAENSSFMEELLGGRVNARGYAAYLLRLRGVYAALERVGRELSADPMVAAVHDPTLDRLGAIDSDLTHWAPEAGRSVDSPATAAYVERIDASRSWGGLYVAHHYTRYLGDLSGGQAIGRILDRTFDLSGRGIAFYDFADIPRPKPYKDAYRARLNALPLAAAEKERIVAEVRVAFGLNQALFEELSADLPSYLAG
jgi:heme oxygenase